MKEVKLEITDVWEREIELVSDLGKVFNKFCK